VQPPGTLLAVLSNEAGGKKNKKGKTKKSRTMKRKEVHVVPQGQEWEVKLSSSKTPHSTFRLKAEAEKAGTALARELETELVIHKKDGTIAEKNSFGNDPVPPKG
jgi:hypothetical protein